MSQLMKHPVFTISLEVPEKPEEGIMWDGASIKSFNLS